MVFHCTSLLTLHFTKDYFLVNLVNLFPLLWEGHKSHFSQVGNTYNLEDHVVLLMVITK